MKIPKHNDDKILSMEDMTLTETTNDEIIDSMEGEAVSDKVALIAIKEILDIKKLKTISRVKFKQVKTLTKLFAFTNVFDIDYTEEIADLILQLQISTNGLGRKELVSLVRQQETINPEQKKLTSKDIFR